jgi:hypothetical protein
MKKLPISRPALIALGVFLGRAAQADTILTFDATPVDQLNNNAINQSFGDTATNSSDGVSVVGFGTPNIDLTWKSNGGESRWDYYNDGGSVWQAAQLNGSFVGTSHRLTFTPHSASARVVIKSFNFHPYYVSTERFTYNVSVVAGTNVVSGPTLISFLSDALKTHPVSINYTGALGQSLKLRLARVASTLGAGEVEGDPYDIAVDDIAFGQLPETTFPTGPQVVSLTPGDEDSGVAAIYYPYFAGITNGDLALAPASIQLRLDGALVSPTISAAAGLTNVSYQGTNLLASGSPHAYTLTYSDTLGASYTNVVQFTAANYSSLPSSSALPLGSGVTRGFTYRTVLADTTNTLPSTLARARAQLAGTLINPDTGQPFTNAATLGTNADGSFNVDSVLNFNDNGTSAGNFFEDQPFPGLEGGPFNWFATEGWLYLDLTNGYYRFGVNSDDGFSMSAMPPQGVSGSEIVLGSFDGGRAAADTLFDVLVQTSGVYPLRQIYFESGGDANVEFFSENVVTGQKVLVNDLTDTTAIKSYSVLRPHISRIVRSGSNVIIEWAYGTPPFQVQVKNDLNSLTWSNVGSPTMLRTATLPIQPGASFFRIAGQ